MRDFFIDDIPMTELTVIIATKGVEGPIRA